ncbi:MAG: AMP-binding protein, partial [Solirubrobacterales bacterium]|nr:AMP-binding protein [Solirubrobacterales bacterium]
RAQAAPSAPCLADPAADLDLDNAAFLDRVQRAAAVLRRNGVEEGDVVAIVLPNVAELIVGLFAAWRVGAAVTTVNPALTLSETQFQVEDSGARVVIGTVEGLEAQTVGADTLAEEPPDATGAVDLADDALALLIYTSGTTGKPKGVMLDHANIDAMCHSAMASLGISEEDHSLLVLPLFHANGIVAGTLTPLLAGGRVTISPRFEPQAFLETIERVRPTYFSAVPAIYAMLSALPEGASADTSSLRIVICGAAPMPAELIQRVEERFGVVLVEGYGLSEGTCASTINPYDGVRKPGTVGLPMADQEVRCVDEDGNEVPTGERGEVLISGPTIMRGYLNRPEETAKTVVDGWLHTGDVGVFDEDGYLAIVDRIKDMIIRGGENIFPKEIETVLYAADGVLEAAVIGRPDERLGEVVVAYVVLREESELTAPDLAAHCLEHLARYKQPVAIEIVDALPKNPVGKIDKPTIRKQDAAALTEA